MYPNTHADSPIHRKSYDKRAIKTRDSLLIRNDLAKSIDNGDISFLIPKKCK